MKKYLFIILLVGVCFGQDTYPYFSDVKKQFEFDKKRIYVKEAYEKEMYVSGGGDMYNSFIPRGR